MSANDLFQRRHPMTSKTEVQAATANNSSMVTIKYMPAKGLRDEFAMAALQGMLASPNDADKPISNRFPTVGDCYASAAYGYADAMLKAREKD